MDKSSMKKAFYLIMAGLAVWVAIDGIGEFDKATTGIGIFRGLFWMVIGLIALRAWWGDFKK